MLRALRFWFTVLACQLAAVHAGLASPAVCAADAAPRSPWNAMWHAEATGGVLPAPSVPGGVVLNVLGTSVAGSAAQAAQPAAGSSQPAPRPMAFEYSDAYNVRRKIHFYASFATIPLFVSQYIVGQKLYDGTGDDGTRSAHSALAVGTGILFGVNSVTGVWNLVESRKDPNHRTKRFVHGIMMLAADAGFLATAALAPETENEDGQFESSGNRSTHRAVAITSMGIAAASYLVMLIGR
jgi:hypothetical protein